MKGKRKTQVWYPRAAECPNIIFMNSCHVRHFIIYLLSWASAFYVVASRILRDRSHINQDEIIHLLRLVHFTTGVPTKALFLCWDTLDSLHGRVITADMPSMPILVESRKAPKTLISKSVTIKHQRLVLNYTLLKSHTLILLWYS